MFIRRKIVEAPIKGGEENEVKYNVPEILMIDCDEKESNKLKEKGFNIELASFGKKYKVLDSSDYKKVIYPERINNIIEKDVIIIDMHQRETDKEYKLLDLYGSEEGRYLTTYKNQKIFNPINLFSKSYEDDFRKLRNKDSIFIIFADREIKENYNVSELKDGFCKNSTFAVSNYEFLPFNINISDNEFQTQKYTVVGKGFFKNILKNYKGKICSRCTFYNNDNNTERLLENIYGDLIGYFQIFENKDETKNTLIVLPQCENSSIIIENILTEILPFFYPEIFKDFVKDTWMNKEEYILPEIKNIIKEKEKIEEEYKIKLDEINKKIKNKQEETKYLYSIISSSGTGDKLVESIIKCLEYLEYPKVYDWDDVKEDDEKEEDIHIYKDENEYFIAEVKGINGPPVEDDCNVIVKYKSRNCSKLKIPSIHGVVFVNYHKNVEPNQREELGFTSKEIKDAVRDEYTLVGTYDLFKAIRLCQENIISKESIRKSLETPGIFRAIPISFEYIGKVDDILTKINVICIHLECDKIKINDELLIIEDNNYYKAKILSLMVNDIEVEESESGDRVGIKIDKSVPKVKSAQLYLIR